MVHLAVFIVILSYCIQIISAVFYNRMICSREYADMTGQEQGTGHGQDPEVDFKIRTGLPATLWRTA